MNATPLDLLALKYETDKYNSHWYTPHYALHFNKWIDKKIKILEIGVHEGGSLQMWKDYFPEANIYGIDIVDRKHLQAERVEIFQGDQTDAQFLKNVVDKIGSPDIIIDDGSHINSHIIKSFEILFPLLNENGIYVVEDLQTSYWPYEGFGGDSENLNNTYTAMNYFKRLTDCLNYEEYIKPGYEPTYFDQNIVSMHFYHNLLFIYKGENAEGSNTIRNNSIAHLSFIPRRDAQPSDNASTF